MNLNKKKIYLSSPHMGKNELEYIKQAFQTNWIAPLGINVDKFEEDIQNYLNIKHALVLSSGTAAIHLALILLGVESEDEVICSDFTFIASVNPIIYQRAIPIFVDSENSTWNMCPDLLENAIKDRLNHGKKPKAIILVHLYGMPSKLNAILEISRKYDIPIIEDAAEALGSKYKGSYLGTFGDLGIFSFNGNKIITTSGGGAIVSKRKEDYEKAKFLGTQARDMADHYQHSNVGYNYRMSNILAGIGRGQMEVLNGRIKARRRIYNYYKKELENFDRISFLDEPQGYFSNRWLTCILLNSLENREKIRIALGEECIEARPLWKPMHLQPIFDGHPSYLNNVSKEIFYKGLCLPSSSNLSFDDLDRIIQIIIKCIND